jgi:hypothetical protein
LLSGVIVSGKQDVGAAYWKDSLQFNGPWTPGELKRDFFPTGGINEGLRDSRLVVVPYLPRAGGTERLCQTFWRFIGIKFQRGFSMRKFIAMLLALAVITPFSIGCGDKKKTETKTQTTKTTDADKDNSTQTTTKTDKSTTTVEGDKDDTNPKKD